MTYLLWPPIVMTGPYVLQLWFLSSFFFFFFPRLISAVGDGCLPYFHTLCGLSLLDHEAVLCLCSNETLQLRSSLCRLPAFSFFLWPPCGIGQTIIFSSYGFFFFFSSSNVSRRRLDIYHTSTHNVALVRIYHACLKCATHG